MTTITGYITQAASRGRHHVSLRVRQDNGSELIQAVDTRTVAAEWPKRMRDLVSGGTADRTLYRFTLNDDGAITAFERV